MYVVRTRLGRSTIPGAGIGLFAAEPISKGQLVWEVRPPWHIEFDPEELEALPSAARDLVLFFGYYDEGDECYKLDIDNGRFTNHSDTPNLVGSDPHSESRAQMFAAHDIAQDEELTINYRVIDGMARNPALRLGRPFRDFLDTMEHHI